MIDGRSEPPALALDEALASSPDETLRTSPECCWEWCLVTAPVAGLDYQLVTASGSFEIDEVVRVGNRTQGGVAGSHVVGLFRTDGGQLIWSIEGLFPSTLAAVVEIGPDRSGRDQWLAAGQRHQRVLWCDRYRHRRRRASP